MLIKSADNKQSAINTLNSLLERTDLTSSQRKRITKEINIMRAGMKGEKEAAYEIDFRFFKKNSIVLHDLRFEVNGRVAQIDHLVIDRALCAYVFESKHFNSGIKINELGEFLSWNSYKKCYEGIPSPIAQNKKHVEVLKDFFKSSEMPTRLGIKLIPSFVPFVLISKQARIDRPMKFDTSSVIKCDALSNTIDQQIDKLSVAETFRGLSRVVSVDTLGKIGRLLKHSHKPIEIDYLAKFGLDEIKETTNVSATKKPTFKAKAPKYYSFHCSKCNSDNTMILSGRYGYYFKCQDCQGNTSIKPSCKTNDCKPKIRKQSNQFFEDCTNCGSSTLFYENKVFA